MKKKVFLLLILITALFTSTIFADDIGLSNLNENKDIIPQIQEDSHFAQEETLDVPTRIDPAILNKIRGIILANTDAHNLNHNVQKLYSESILNADENAMSNVDKALTRDELINLFNALNNYRSSYSPANSSEKKAMDILAELESPSLNKIADTILADLNITYDNYAYYRSVINDSSNPSILKLYSEGIIKTDQNGMVYPDKILTGDDLIDIFDRVNNPQFPTRPTYELIANIPVLMYHEINLLPKNGPTGLYVSQENFKKQLDSLIKEGYNTVTMEEVYQHWTNDLPLPNKPIVLTFDDGYVSHYNFVLKELAKRGQTGTFYIITSTVGTNQVQTKEGLRKMYEEGMEIGSHTVDHIDARSNNNTVLTQQYKESKSFLEDAIGGKVEHFCHPFGGATNASKQILKNLGYKTAVRTSYGKANRLQGIYDLKRIRIDYNDSIKGFLNKIK